MPRWPRRRAPGLRRHHWSCDRYRTGSSCGAINGTPGRGPCVFAVAHDANTVNKYVSCAHGVLMRFFEGGAIANFVRVEDGYVGEKADTKRTTIFDVQVFGRQSGKSANRFFERSKELR